MSLTPLQHFIIKSIEEGTPVTSRHFRLFSIFLGSNPVRRANENHYLNPLICFPPCVDPARIDYPTLYNLTQLLSTLTYEEQEEISCQVTSIKPVSSTLNSENL